MPRATRSRKRPAASIDVQDLPRVDEDTIIQDLQSEVQDRAQQLRAQADTLTSKLVNTLTVELMRLPKRVRTMTLEEFFATYGGDVDTVLKDRVPFKPSTAHNEARPPRAAGGKPPATVRRGGSSAPAPAPATVRRGTGGARRGGRPVLASTPGRRSRVSSGPVPATPVGLGGVGVPCTPGGPMSVPCTPGTVLRQPKAGELLVSANGSPIASGAAVAAAGDAVTIAVELPTGMTNLADVEPDQLDGGVKSMALEKLTSLQSQVAALMARLG